ncbi:putative pectinesterase inhibitor domain-containing protein [Rosa chinensis]|uniref:Putative pectinesterase inhibitor domain-containing protein n=1 Tax=Rosa chinensis TaxID=74649 RepID=A0A2P6PZP9_ROSCH|nr:putative pectinesterase inhibitor domain-containing protein [Rosa chinensis]
MATKNMIMILVLVISTILAIGVVSAQKETNSMRLAARDAITLAVSEISNTQKFINTIPRLKTVETAMPNEAALGSCVVGLIDSLSNAHSVLQRMRHLNKATLPFIDSDVDALMSAVVSRIASFNNVCQVGLKDVDKTIVLMLNRKLEDIMMLSNNVINHVSEIKRTEQLIKNSG